MKLNFQQIAAIIACSWVALFRATAQDSSTASPASTPTPTVSLNPPSPPEPPIHGARVFGVRPERPFLFTVGATGDRPMTFSADNLPRGLVLDSATGQITGTALAAGDYAVTLHGPDPAARCPTRPNPQGRFSIAGLTPSCIWMIVTRCTPKLPCP